MQSPADDELHEERRDEAVRRASLYGVTSKKRLPKVHLAPRDARTRRELQILIAPQQLVVHDGLSMYEEELEQRKHLDHLGIRPALDQSQPLRDLFTTVPRQLLTHAGSEAEIASVKPQHPREWRVGYKNDPQSDFHGAAMRGVFEPTDSLRESLAHTPAYRHSSSALAYPLPFTTATQVAQQLEPQDADKDRKELEAKLHAGMVSPTKGTSRKPHWSPASLGIPATNTFDIKTKKKTQQRLPKTATLLDQRHAVRKVASPLQKTPLAADERCVLKRQAQVATVNEAYTQLHQQALQGKDPTVRYSLPVENHECPRSYRLGLDAVPSSIHEQDAAHMGPGPASTTTCSTPLLFRPKSAVSLRLDTAMSPASKLPRSSSTASLLVPSAAPRRVAGAKRRPHSATLSYLSHSTVYCMEPSPSASVSMLTMENAHQVIKHQRKFGAEVLGVLLQERARRQQAHSQSLAELAARGVLHSIPMPQIFARLRRDAMKNLTKRVEQARYDKLSMDEYMSLCGMAVVPGTPVEKHEELRRAAPDEEDDTEPQYAPAEPDEDPVARELHDQLEIRQLPYETEPRAAVFRKRKALRPEPTEGNNSSTILAFRRALFVTREQFHIAMEAFALSSRDVNLLFSAVDLAVADAVPVWQIICAVEQLQDGHEEIRRARVQVKAAKHLPKELAQLRRSVAFPHAHHVPLPIGSL